MFEAISEIFWMYVAQILAKVWLLIATAMDFARNLGAVGAGLIVAGLSLTMFGVAKLNQSRLTKLLREDPEAQVSMASHEFRFTILWGLWFLIAWPYYLAKWIWSKFSSGDDESGEDAEDEEPVRLVVASIGPSFFLASLWTAGLFLASWAAEPLLRAQFELSQGHPAWQYLLLGHRPEMSWYLPLSRFPYLGAVLTGLLWMTIWWWAARVIRIYFGEQLGRNLVDEHDNPSFMPLWREWFAVGDLVDTEDSYERWAKWVVLAAVPFLLWSWGTLDGDPYRMKSSMFVVAYLVWFGWALHLMLSGYLQIEESHDEDEDRQWGRAGWPEVLEELEERKQVQEPQRIDEDRPVPARRFQPWGNPLSKFVSPMCRELLPEQGKLTRMQADVLQRLSQQGFVHLDPPADPGELTLQSRQGTVMEDETGDRHRNQVVLAPEGAGKTTLGRLAAVNQALTHTRSTLFVLRDEAAAKRCARQMRRSIKNSTLRWTVRVRQVGGELVNDLADGVIPEVVVTSLHQLVVNVLEEPADYESFLQTCGLVVVDEVEAYCGPVEQHAKLAFRRLRLRLREAIGVNYIGEEMSPSMLILGAKTMENTPQWAKSLCGVDAVSRVYGYDSQTERQAEGNRHQEFYRLSDFQDGAGRRVTVGDVVRACEKRGVPWHYRPAGDGRRDRGRGGLNLRQEPEHYVEEPSEAAVVFLQGHHSQVLRERARLTRAGFEFDPRQTGTADGEQLPEPSDRIRVAMIALVDPDQETALTERNRSSTMHQLVETLPRPILRPPRGRMVESHLGAELVDNWVKTADIVEVFGGPVTPTLMELAREDLLLTETRVGLDDDNRDYENLVFLRVPNRAIESGEEEDEETEASEAMLPPVVTQVEIASGETVAIRDETNSTPVAEHDADSARLVYYPRRVFERASGRYMVTGVANLDGEGTERADILAEPFLDDERSSPRRRTRVTPIGRVRSDGEGGLEAEGPEQEEHERAASRLGLLSAIAQSRVQGESGAAEGAGEGMGEGMGEESEDFEKIRRSFEGPGPPDISEQSSPVFIGDAPIGTWTGDVELEIEHVATMLVSPDGREVRQRIPVDESTPLREISFTSRGLAILPNPLAADELEDAPGLTLEGARLVAATLRAVLPAMYRGSDEAIEVALYVDEPEPEPDYELGPGEGLFLYGPARGGNGVAGALERDGVEFLLRFCRLYLERVLTCERLLSMHDYWGDEEEILGRRQGFSRADEGDRARDKHLRQQALQWLDSRLRPEGSASGGLGREELGSGAEPGEGDTFDLGRCWYSSDGDAGDLVWTKHRWGLGPLASERGGREAMLDIGFDRVATSRLHRLSAGDDAVEDDVGAVKRGFEDESLEMEDGSIWGAPRPIWVLHRGGEPERVGGQPPEAEQVALLAATMNACLPALQPMVRRLVEEADRVAGVAKQGEQAGQAEQADGKARTMAIYLSQFVRGIPERTKTAERGLASPVDVLLSGEGTSLEKSLLLATLLSKVGIDAGLFVGGGGREALAAAALPEPVSDEDIVGAAVASGRWLDQYGLDPHALVWSELPPAPDAREPVTQAYLPIESSGDSPVGVTPALENPGEWSFVPLTVLRRHMTADASAGWGDLVASSGMAGGGEPERRGERERSDAPSNPREEVPSE